MKCVVPASNDLVYLKCSDSPIPDGVQLIGSPGHGLVYAYPEEYGCQQDDTHPEQWVKAPLGGDLSSWSDRTLAREPVPGLLQIIWFDGFSTRMRDETTARHSLVISSNKGSVAQGASGHCPFRIKYRHSLTSFLASKTVTKHQR